MQISVEATNKSFFEIFSCLNNKSTSNEIHLHAFIIDENLSLNVSSQI